MRDSGKPYSGDPRKNKLLPLPRPTYTEFINRAKRAKCLERLDFLYCAADAAMPPRLAWADYERVVWCGVSFRRFARQWTPERAHFFSAQFQRKAFTVLCAMKRQERERLQKSSPGKMPTSFGALPEELVHNIIARAATKSDCHHGEYDGLDVIVSKARHLFLPAPGSSADRDTLFDAAFGLK